MPFEQNRVGKEMAISPTTA